MICQHGTSRVLSHQLMRCHFPNMVGNSRAELPSHHAQILRIAVIHLKRVIAEPQHIEKKSGIRSCEIAYGITSRTAEQADPQRILNVNRGHWTIENSCHYIIDWNYDEDRSRIRTGYGPENITRLRRFAIGVIKSKNLSSVAQKMRELTRNVRLVFDYLRMTKNSCAHA